MVYLIFKDHYQPILYPPHQERLFHFRVLVCLGMSSVTQKYVQMTFLILELFLEYIPPLPMELSALKKLSNYLIEEYLH